MQHKVNRKFVFKMSDSKRTFGYARVSTPDQNLDMQIQALEKAGCEKIWSEKKSADAPRAQFALLVNHLRKGDTIVVWKLDRLARNLWDLKEWTERFEELGVHFVCITDKIDTSTAMGKVFFHITAAFAQLERDLIAERTKAGIAARKLKGYTFGRPTKIVGEKRDAIEADIRDLSLTMREVADRHGYRSLTTLNRHFPKLRQQCLIEAGQRKPNDEHRLVTAAKQAARIAREELNNED